MNIFVSIFIISFVESQLSNTSTTVISQAVGPEGTSQISLGPYDFVQSVVVQITREITIFTFGGQLPYATVTTSSSTAAALFQVTQAGTLNLQYLTIYFSIAGTILVNVAGRANIRNCKFTTEAALGHTQPAIKGAATGVVNVSDTTFFDTNGLTPTGSIIITDSPTSYTTAFTLILERCSFLNVTNRLGGPAVKSESNTQISDSRFQYCSAANLTGSSGGGAVYMASNGQLTVQSSFFYSCSAFNGGAIRGNSGNVISLDYVVFSKCSSINPAVDKPGTAVYLSTTSSASIMIRDVYLEMCGRYALYDAGTVVNGIYSTANVLSLYSDANNADDVFGSLNNIAFSTLLVGRIDIGETYVDGVYGNDAAQNPTCGKQATPCQTLGRAVIIASMPKRLHILPGTLSENENSIVFDDNVLVFGEGTDPESTTITSQNEADCLFEIRQGAVVFATLKFVHQHSSYVGNFFLVTGGFSDVPLASSLNFTNVVFTQQRTQDYAAGAFIYVDSSAACTLFFNASHVRNISCNVSPFDVRGAQDGTISVFDTHFERISANSYGGVIFTTDAANFTSCNFSFVSAQKGGGVVYTTSSRVILIDSIFSACTSQQFGGVVVTNLGGVFIIRGHFENCQSVQEGGVARSGNRLEVNDSVFVNCSSQQAEGGALYLDTRETYNVNLLGSAFIDCRAASLGGAVYSNIGVTANTCNFSTASARLGGAIYTATSVLTVVASQFSQCTASENGAALAAFSSLEITLSYFAACNTAGNGTVFVRGNATLTGVTFALNVAQHGGAIFVDNVPGVNSTRVFAVSEGTAFLKNTAMLGGAIYLHALPKTVGRTLANTVFDGNTASTQEGGNDIFDELANISSADFDLISDGNYTLTSTCSLSLCTRVNHVPCDEISQDTGLNFNCIGARRNIRPSATLNTNCGQDTCKSLSGILNDPAQNQNLLEIMASFGVYDEDPVVIAGRTVVVNGTSAYGDFIPPTSFVPKSTATVFLTVGGDGGYFSIRSSHLAVASDGSQNLIRIEGVGLLDISDCRIAPPPSQDIATGSPTVLFAPETSLGALNIEHTMVQAISLAAGSSILDTRGRTRFTISNCSFSQINQAVGGGGGTGGGGVVIHTTAPLTVQLTTFEDIGVVNDNVWPAVTAGGGVIFTTNDATLTDITVRNVRGGFGGFLYASGPRSTAVIERANINNVNSSGAGGAIFSSSILRLTECAFLNTFSLIATGTLTTVAGGGSVYSTAQLTVLYCAFYNTSSAFSGGAVKHVGPRTGFGGQVRIEGTAFVNCSVTSGEGTGGAVSCGGEVTINICEFINMSTTYLGGAVEAGAELTIARTTFTNSSTTQHVPDTNRDTTLAGGGAVVSRVSVMSNIPRHVSLNIVSFINCVSSSYGGGIRVLNNTGLVNFTNCGFYTCQAKFGGGGIALTLSNISSSSPRVIAYTNFFENSVENGVGVDVYDTTTNQNVWSASGTAANVIASCSVHLAGAGSPSYFALVDYANSNATLDRTSLLDDACITYPRLVRADGTDAGNCQSAACATIAYAVGLTSSGTDVTDVSVGGGSTSGAVFVERTGITLAGRTATIHGADSSLFRVTVTNSTNLLFLFSITTNAVVTFSALGFSVPDFANPSDSSGFLVGVLGSNNSVTFGDIVVRQDLEALSVTGSFLYIAAAAGRDVTVLIRNSIFGPLASSGPAGVYAQGGATGASLSVVNTTFVLVGAVANRGDGTFAGRGRSICAEIRLLINNSMFMNCSSGVDGSAVFAGYTANITNSSFSYCTSSPGNGGGLAVSTTLNTSTAPYIDIRNSNFEYCASVSGVGGAIYLNIVAQARRNFQGVSFENNTAVENGGANIVDFAGNLASFTLSNFVRCCSRGTALRSFIVGDPFAADTSLSTDLTSLFSLSCQTVRHHITAEGSDDAAGSVGSCSVDAPCATLTNTVNLVITTERHEVEVGAGLYTNEVFTLTSNHVNILGVSSNQVAIQGKITLSEESTLVLERLSVQLTPSRVDSQAFIIVSGSTIGLEFFYIYITSVDATLTADLQAVITIASALTSVFVTFSNTTVLDITSGYGGVGALSDLNLTATSSVWSNVTGRSDGSVFSIAGTGSNVNIQRSNFTDIMAVSISGDVYKNGAVLSTASSFRLQSSRFLRCTSLNGGAVYFVAPDTITSLSFNIFNCTFSKCSAREVGGALYLQFVVPAAEGLSNQESQAVDQQRYLLDVFFSDNTAAKASDVFDYFGNTSSYVTVFSDRHTINIINVCSNSSAPQYGVGNGENATVLSNIDETLTTACRNDNLYVNSALENENPNCGSVQFACKTIATAVSMAKSSAAFVYIQLVGNNVPYYSSEIYITSSLTIEGRATGSVGATIIGDVNYRVVFVVQVFLTLNTTTVNLTSGRVGRDTTFMRVNGSGQTTLLGVLIQGPSLQVVTNSFISIEEVSTELITFENTSFSSIRLSNYSVIYTGSNSPLLVNTTTFTNISGAALGLCLNTHSPTTIENSRFSLLDTSEDCAGVYGGYSKTLILNTTHFYAVHSKGNGSAVYINSYIRDTNVVITKSSFAKCQSDLYGGAIYFNITATSYHLIGNTAFFDNVAGSGKGNDIYAESSQVQHWTQMDGSCSNSSFPQITFLTDQTGTMENINDLWDNVATTEICKSLPYIPDNNTNDSNKDNSSSAKSTISLLPAVIAIGIVLVVAVIVFIVVLIVFNLYWKRKVKMMNDPESANAKVMQNQASNDSNVYHSTQNLEPRRGTKEKEEEEEEEVEEEE